MWNLGIQLGSELGSARLIIGLSLGNLQLKQAHDSTQQTSQFCSNEELIQP